MAEPALRLVNTETGEITDTCPTCADLRVQLEQIEKDIRSWRARYSQLARDKELEAQEHPLWTEALDLFAAWKRECRHPRSEWGADRFYVVAPLLKKYGYAMCRRAIAGAAYDAYSYRQRNGALRRCDEWERVFKDSGALERHANKAPKGWALKSKEGGVGGDN